MLEAARLLSGDHAFRQAFGTRDHGTILSALNNHSSRVQADVMMLLGLDGDIIADTLHPDLHHVPFPYATILDRAADSDTGEASGIQIMDGQSFQLVVVPLYAPVPSAWIIVGFRIDDSFAEVLQQHTRSEVSLITELDTDNPIVIASTLPMSKRDIVCDRIKEKNWIADVSGIFNMEPEEYVSLVTPVWRAQGIKIVAVLQRSLDVALESHTRLRKFLVFVFLVSVVLSVGGGIVMAGTVTRPVQLLAEGARRIGDGDYSTKVEVAQQDEMGELANSFNRMAAGLAERDKVRNLLGKVVSPEVAQELLKQDIELGGEERVVTVLFVDIRGFTSLCEGRSPAKVLHVLNTYLTCITRVIEEHGGVVDKYIGDAVMALFGAPLSRNDEPARAVAAGLAIAREVDVLNRERQEDDWAQLNIGVGVNTGLVVAGNMGSESRLNYTVVGDAVNLAARVEGLTKVYGVPMVVTEATRNHAPTFSYRELDRVRVKGKSDAVVIYQPLGNAREQSPASENRNTLFASALEKYRQKLWDEALAILHELQAQGDNHPAIELYLNRIRACQNGGVPVDWDGTTVFEAK